MKRSAIITTDGKITIRGNISKGPDGDLFLYLEKSTSPIPYFIPINVLSILKKMLSISQTSTSWSTVINGVEYKLEIHDPQPQPLATPDFSALVSMATEHIEAMAAGKSARLDIPHYMYEEIMKAVYGADIFDWINSNV